MATEIRPAHGLSSPPQRGEVTQVRLYGHSAFFYWWPLWMVGYVMALLTLLHHDVAVIGNKPEWFHPSRDLGVVYTLLLLLLVVLTSTKVRGMKAAVIIAALCFLALLFVHLEWWEAILGWFGQQAISLSLGYYLFSASGLLFLWLVSVFFIDHLSYWRVRPGQITHEYIGGIVNNTYDTDGMTVSLNRQDDFFRHWVIGIGSGDLRMQMMGGRGVEINIPNVLLVGSKMADVQRLIATVPDVPMNT